ncbi:molybdopterin-dependent oxidoreductase [Sulfitobacter sp. M57]|uniref:molybdopterin oxidoreductase family protein n=1 Tax=unclassified Sulfitobacter TaxID=196795 RepID=UPI0023E0F05A|nr:MULTISPECIES: molybdopterin oxidoreductase family protein [unclassified Sulfitobacter]MDF3414675.1 molybdopterin-dependent oxidoreductase [Sulfitobacter sp. KE5]MDF3422156.1 molybdopterin-dependent oxidoreductase [Sulfitobacter sp. KE43]MDF3433221.1 molybdopterin-dependent oxidoreductase [Sulfitobacter sp. KE42]MDF3458861.1 molybdopterin-dependent oxidoreductase [Sulfitobacter sp. S74]MDF3462760.1 molybdopterin-dependent oxidoreductase [Sulfitobacter sp. Ks18]
MNQPVIDLSPKVSDEVRKTTCYMCACRCGINVHMKEGKVAYIEGNRDHPVNKGVLCAKGSAGIMQHNAPSRLKSPLKRVGPRGSGEFEEISWDEAYQIAADWLEPIRKDNPEKLAFFTGRDQSQSFTSLWAQAFGTPNYAAHGGFCSVNMAAAGIYTMGGAFWEFGQPDWDHTKLFMLFGVAEDHDSNPIKMGIGKIKGRGARVIGVNPIRTGYNAVADDWVGITPGTDGLFILSMIHCLMKAGKIDLHYLAQYTDAPVLVNGDEKSPEFGLYLRDENGKQLVVDRVTGKLTAYDTPGVKPDLSATHRAKGVTHKPVFHKMAEMYLSDEYAPEAVAERCGIPAKRIRAIAAELARVAFDEAFELDHAWTDFRGEKHTKMTGRPVSFHSMRGISAHANGFQTCRALHTLQIILGTVEVPGGFRFKPPYPKPATAHPKPHVGMTPGAPLNGPHLGFVHGPDDLALKDDGTPARIDKAFTWENPMSSHGLMHMVISNAHAGDPYKIDTLFMYMANMSWNSSMNTGGVMEMLTDKDENGDYVIPHIIYSDAYSSEMVAYSDLILPDTTYLERHDCISLLDRPICEADAAADAIRWPVVEPDRNVKGFQSALCDLGAKLGLPGFVNDDGSQKYADYADYITNHERRPGIGPLAGWRMGEKGLQSGRGGVNASQIDNYIENGGFFVEHIPDGANYYKPWNMGYQKWAVDMGLFDSPQPYLFSLYVEPMRKFQLAAEGHGDRQPPEHLRQRIKDTMSPLPIWYDTDQEGNEGYTINALTQRPMAMYHSWGSQNAWLRQLHGRNPLYLPTKLMRQNDLTDGDWAQVSSPHGEITVPVMEMAALNENTVWTWNAIGKRKGAWALDRDAPEATKGFLLNHLIHELLPPKADGMRWANSDPITGQAAWFDLKVKIKKAVAPKESRPEYPPIKSPVGQGPDTLAWKVGK